MRSNEDVSAPDRRSHARLPHDVPPSAPVAYVYPGQLFVSASGVVASTILGTCVSVCLFDAAAGVGGLNHFMLPGSPRSSAPSPRFGDVATQELLDEVRRVGAAVGRLQAKLFGGMA